MPSPPAPHHAQANCPLYRQSWERSELPDMLGFSAWGRSAIVMSSTLTGPLFRPLQQRFQFVFRQSGCEIVSLDKVTALSRQEIKLLLGFHPFRDRKSTRLNS